MAKSTEQIIEEQMGRMLVQLATLTSARMELEESNEKLLKENIELKAKLEAPKEKGK